MIARCDESLPRNRARMFCTSAATVSPAKSLTTVVFCTCVSKPASERTFKMYSRTPAWDCEPIGCGAVAINCRCFIPGADENVSGGASALAVAGGCCRKTVTPTIKTMNKHAQIKSVRLLTDFECSISIVPFSQSQGSLCGL